MDNYYKNINIMHLILKWKWQILIIMVIGAVAGAVFSGPTFVTPLYKSEATIYPANIMPYSDESETEQMLQILQSNSIRDNVIAKYDLANHYGVPADYKHFLALLYYEYNSHISISKTEYESVEIIVNDEDPQIACAIAEDIMALYDEKLKTLHRKKFGEALENYTQVIALKNVEADSVRVRIAELSRTSGLVDITAQSREVARGVIANNQSAKKIQASLVENNAEFSFLKEVLLGLVTNISDLKRERDRVLVQFNSDYTYSNVVSYPFVSDKKVFPVRWVIVVASMIAAAFFAIVVIGIIEAVKRAEK